MKDKNKELEPMEPPEELKGALRKLAGRRKIDEIMREVKEGWVWAQEQDVEAGE